MGDVPADVQRWTAKRRFALVIRSLRERTRRSTDPEDPVMSDKGDAALRTKWRELGFFAEFSDDEAKRWLIVGSADGLRRFCKLLRAYAADPRNEPLSEHEHCGPYGHLKLVTCSEPTFKRDGLYGRLDDFRRLADLIAGHLPRAVPGEIFEIDGAFSPNNEYALRVEVAPDEFDPPTRDRHLSPEGIHVRSGNVWLKRDALRESQKGEQRERVR